MPRELTPKQKIFCIEYVKCHNATEAARIAEYSQPRMEGSRLLTNDVIRNEIKRLEGNKEIDARLNFADEAENAFKVLKDIMADKEQPGSVRVNAAKDILDRAGYKPIEKKQIEATISLEDILGELDE